MNGHMAIAIDGPAAAGKSTIAKNLSEKLGYLYIDTGALYRAIGYFALRSGAVPSDAEQVRPLLSQINLRLFHQDGTQHISVNGEDVTEAIRRPEMSMAASNVSAIPEVRDFLLSLQQRMAQENDVVMDGRDIGTVVLPGAEMKFYLTATPEARAKRRYLEFVQKGEKPDFDALLTEIIQRDYNDSHRAVAPLRRAEDAILVDNTEMTLHETLGQFLALIKEKL